ncbi:MAG: hypothetical protein IJW86_04620 [Clostridia bacterium]|nr:hypothetical protein [Clostridia bacterium]
MKRSEIKDLIKSAIEPRNMCRIFFKYDTVYSYYFPLKVSEKLFLGAVEDDFILDGFSIRRFTDVEKIESKDDKCVDIIREEGILENLDVPDIDLTDWYSVFLSLEKLDKNIIIERESLDEDEYEFAIGHIEKVLKSKVLFRHFDADAIWQDELWEIPYSGITSITFLSRYVEIFSKYL